MNPYLLFFLFFLGITGFVVVSLGLNALLGPKSQINDRMQEPFECGATVIEKENIRKIPIKYYAFAVMFILFDLEGIFLYLWARASHPISTFSFFAFLLFMFFFILLFAYAWRKKILEIK